MGTIAIPLTLHGPSFPDSVSDAAWRVTKFKDLSAGGACETGYGDQSKVHKALQQLADFKHSEKHTPPLGWAVTVIPALLDMIPKIIFHDNKFTPLFDIPARTHAVLKEKIGNISAKQLGFLLGVIPIYTGARLLKNHIWPGHGFDPSGHTMFKIAQYGMMHSIATDHGTKSRINAPVIFYLTVTAIADAAMLGNTIANCHTLAEIVVGGGIGILVILIAHFVSKHTPLGSFARRVSMAVGEVFNEVGTSIRRCRRLIGAGDGNRTHAISLGS